jgi:hypothetical protein
MDAQGEKATGTALELARSLDAKVLLFAVARPPEPATRVEFDAMLDGRLRVTCEYIDKLLGEIREILHASYSKVAFPRFLPDIAPAQSRTIEDYLVRLRAQLVRVLDGQAFRARSLPYRLLARCMSR